jgi:hypothetical protein
MTTQNSTTETQATTLTEKELFAEFTEASFMEYDRLGNRIYQHSVADLLEMDGRFDHINLDINMHNVGDCPSHDLEMVEDALNDALASVKLAREAFEHQKRNRQIFPEEPGEDASSEEQDAWEEAYDEAEKNPRYRPLLTSDVQEVA